MRRLVAVLILACAGCESSKPPSPPTTPTPTSAAVSALSVTGPGCVEGVCSGLVGSTVQLSAKAALSDSTTQDVTAQTQWSSTNANVASVSAGGLVTFRAAGDADIVAAYQGFSARQTMRLTSCGYTPPVIPAFDAAGGSGSVTVETPSACRSTVVSGDPWIRIGGTGPIAGSRVPFTVDPNRSFAGRTGSIVVKDEAGGTVATYSVSQRAAGCLYSTDPATLTLDWSGTYDGAGDFPKYVRVHAEPATCQWTATSSVPWAQIVYGSDHGSGDQLIYVSLIQWNSGPTRSGEVVVAGLSGVNPDARLAVTQTARR